MKAIYILTGSVILVVWGFIARLILARERKRLERMRKRNACAGWLSERGAEVG
jgi:hypothetical protein